MTETRQIVGRRRRAARRVAACAVAVLFATPAAIPAARAASDAERPAGDSRVVEVFPGVRMAFQWIPPTTGAEWLARGSGDYFLMGSPETEPDREVREGPVTRVRLTRGFWLGRFEVTQAQWQAVMGYNPSVHRAAGPDAPVERVSWNDTQAFLRILNERAAAGAPDGAVLRFRLPTEAEWEFACRAGTTGAYAFGETLDATQANFDDGRPERARLGPRPVGSYAPNAWGLHDLHGNVWEWCENVHVVGLPGGMATDLFEVPPGEGRTVRGGSWFGGARLCRSAYRSAHRKPDTRVANIGFRIAMEEGIAPRSEQVAPSEPEPGEAKP